MRKYPYLAGFSILIAVIFVIMAGISHATPPARPDDVQWSRTYEGNGTLTGTSYTFTDTGLVFCGYADIPGKGIRGYAIRGDVYGHQYWAKEYGLEGDSYFYKILRMMDNNCLLVGETRQANGNGQGLVAKIDRNGSVIFIKSYNAPGDSGSFSDAITEPDGDTLLVGTSRSAGGNTSVWLVSIDLRGKAWMEKVLGVNGSCSGDKIVMAYDGGYTIIGTVQPEDTPYKRAYAIHVDDNCSKLWEQAYSGPGSDADVIYPCAYGYLLASHTGGNIDLYRLNLSGAVYQHSSIEGSVDREVAAITGAIDGGWVFVGDETGAGGKKAGFIMKVDADGQPEWNRTFRGDKETSLRDMTESLESYFCFGTEGGKFWLVDVGTDLSPDFLPSCGCLPWLVLPVLAAGLVARARRQR